MSDQTAHLAPTADSESFFVHESGGELDQELARRLKALGEQPHRSSECSQPVDGLFKEGLVWMVIGAVIWVLAMIAGR